MKITYTPLPKEKHMINHFPWQNYLPTHPLLCINFRWVRITYFDTIHLPTPPKKKKLPTPTYLPLSKEDHMINHPSDKATYPPLKKYSKI